LQLRCTFSLQGLQSFAEYHSRGGFHDVHEFAAQLRDYRLDWRSQLTFRVYQEFEEMSDMALVLGNGSGR
jgi:hypothetical protein